ncbi:MAG: acylglycerol kinase family protein, partial [Verrucomicrobiae bacterium]|nr:acylglycerol kinase family protein [Verrucomicrobiae bacterium]
MRGRFFIIVNPAAGAGKAARRWETLRRRIREFCSSFHTVYTEGPGHAIALARENAGDCNAVVAVGGDGTTSEVASGLLQSGQKSALA